MHALAQLQNLSQPPLGVVGGSLTLSDPDLALPCSPGNQSKPLPLLHELELYPMQGFTATKTVGPSLSAPCPQESAAASRTLGTWDTTVEPL